MKQIIILVLLLKILVFSQNCSVILEDKFLVIATLNETKEWDMQKYLFNGEDLHYSIEGDCPYFETLDPMFDQVTKNQQFLKIRSLKARRSMENNGWLGDFIQLGQNKTDCNVFLSLGQQKDVAPNFSTNINVANNTKNIRCFDVEFFTQTKIIVDCLQQNDEEIQNGFFLIDAVDQSYYDIQFNYHPDGYNYNYTEYRKILFHNYSFINVGEDQEQIEGGLQGDKVQLLFRGEPAWATEHADLSKNLLDDDCELEVYRFSNNKLGNDGKPVTVLTKEVIADLLKTDKTKSKFYLMDFKLEPNGDIYVLDAYNGVYVLYFNDQLLTWQLKSRISPPYITICYGFDFNYLFQKDGGYVKHLVLVFKDFAIFYENGLQKFSIKLPSKVSYGNIQVQMSQYYLVLRIDNIMYMYDSEDGTKLYTYTKDYIEQMIINPYEPDIVAVNEVSSHRFLLTNGLLRLKKQDKVTDSTKFCKIQATNQQQTCLLSVQVQVVNKNDTQVYEQKSHFLPNSVTIHEAINLKQIASGPNLQYQGDYQLDQIFSNFQQISELNLNGINLINPWDVNYSDIQVVHDDSVFFLLLQSSKKIVYIYKCTHKIENYKDANCVIQVQFIIQVQFSKTRNNFFWQIYGGDYIIYEVKEDDYTIKIYESFLNNFRNVGTIYIDKKDTQNKITSLSEQQSSLFVVQGLKKNIQVYSRLYRFKLIYEINEQVLAEFNIKEPFTPVKVYANEKINSQLIIIQTTLYLQIGYFIQENSYSSYVFLQNIPIKSDAEIDVSIGQKTFFVIQTVNDYTTIEEYNYQNVNKIYKTKELPLYNYVLQKPLTISTSQQGGYLCLRAKNTNQETVILIYKPDEIYRNSLYKVYNTNTFNFDLKSFDLVVDGKEQMFLYFNNQTYQSVISVLEQVKITFESNEENQKYVNEQLLILKISNYPENENITIYSQIQIINTLNQVKINQALFDQKQKVFRFIKSNLTQIINMGNDWYDGEIVNFKVDCKSCGDNLQIQQKMTILSDGQDMVYDFTAGISYKKGGQIYQRYNSILFQDISGRFVKIIYIQTTFEFCELLTTSEDETFIISTWKNQKLQVGIYIHQCTSTYNCSQFRQGFETITGIDVIRKIKMIDEKNILLLFDNQQSESFLLITEFTYTPNSYSISNRYVIDNQFVGSQKLNIRDFETIKFLINGTTYYTLIMTDINKGLYFVQFVKNSQGSLVKTIFELFKLTSFVSDQYFLYDNTKFQQVKVINQKLIESVLQLNVLVTTNNAASYVFGFDLDVSKPAYGATIIKSQTSLLYILPPYGNWQSLNQISTFDQHVALTYSYNYKIVIAVYQIPNVRTNNTEILKFTHSINSDEKYSRQDDVLNILNKAEGQQYPYLFTNLNYDLKTDEYLIQMYKLQDDPKLIITNSLTFDDSVQITIEIMNDFYKSSGTAYLQVNGTKFETQQNKHDELTVKSYSESNLRSGTQAQQF